MKLFDLLGFKTNSCLFLFIYGETLSNMSLFSQLLLNLSQINTIAIDTKEIVTFMNLIFLLIQDPFFQVF